MHYLSAREWMLKMMVEVVRNFACIWEVSERLGETCSGTHPREERGGGG